MEVWAVGVARVRVGIWRSAPATRSPWLVLCALLAVCGVAAHPAHPVTIDWVAVGDPGNASDRDGWGDVAYPFRIGKHEVTIGQYAEFLNAVDRAGSNPYLLYNAAMAGNSNIAGISFTPAASNGFKYAALPGSGNKPVSYVSWFDAARFANWMHNGQGAGSTETGAYTLNGAMSGYAPASNPGARYRLPTEDEWYKAAFYKGGSTTAGYWKYATQSDTAPGNTLGGSLDGVNYLTDALVYSVTQSPTWSAGQNYLTDVGSFTGSPSRYGTFDQSGNVYEWNEDPVPRPRGGSWASNAHDISSASRVGYATFDETASIGFRLAGPATVPEIDASGTGLTLALVGAVAGLLERRRPRVA